MSQPPSPGGGHADLERALRTGLDGYDLDPDDLAVLDTDHDGDDPGPTSPVLPVVAVVGRPNVGKSTLVNRILGRREAVVQDVPGVTRDRVSYPAQWAGRDFTLVDTGGWESDVAGLAARVAEQAALAARLADVVVLAVDARTGATATDEAVVRLLRRAGTPVVLAANKVDDARTESDATALWNLGVGTPHPVSALHGRGSGDLLDAIVAAMPPPAAPTATSGDTIHRVALVGRPNVGKSSLLNALAGTQRVVVDDVAGTTRDPVDELVTLGGQRWVFVDTAGVRRRVHQTSGADFYASLRTTAAIERAEVALVLLEADQRLTEQDTRVISAAVEAGRALVLAYNKWDLLDDERRESLEREIATDLAHVAWAPRVNLSAATGRHLDRLAPALATALASWTTRVPTGELNAFLGTVAAATPHPVRGGKQPRVLFATQAQVAPPTFVLFASGFLEAGYRRFLERRLREEYGFAGSPVAISVRVRERRSRR